MKISKEFKVGLLALVVGVIFYVGLNFLKGADLFSGNNRYYVRYENVDGLTRSNPVLLNGLSVGRVEEIRLLPEKGNQLLVGIDVRDDIDLNDNTVAMLSNSDLLGSKAIELVVNQGSRVAEDGDTLIPMVDRGISTLLQEKAIPALENLDSITVALRSVVGEFQGTIKNINAALGTVEQTSGVLQTTVSENRRALNGTLGNVEELTASLVTTEQELKPLLSKMTQIADTLSQAELAEAVNNANASLNNLNQVMSRISEGEGSLGKLTQDEELYNNLNRSSRDLDRLLRDVRANPKRYLPPLIQIGGRKAKQEASEE